jgi:hypothetical protein
MADRLRRKVEGILAKHGDDRSAADRELDRTLDAQEVLTTGLLPLNSALRTRILGAWLRERDRKDRLEAQRQAMKAEEMVPVEVPGGGKCKITVWMTKKQAERERASR